MPHIASPEQSLSQTDQPQVEYLAHRENGEGAPFAALIVGESIFRNVHFVKVTKYCFTDATGLKT